MFRGADDRDKIKSLKLPFGYIGVTHFEERDQFDGAHEIRTLLQTTMRGGESFWNFGTYNPPAAARHWANADARTVRENRAVLHTDYRSMPPAWLGQAFLDEAAQLQRENEAAYRHEYLGLAGGMGEEVFGNLELRRITDEEKLQFDRCSCGVDWGFYPDPYAANLVYYRAAARTAYIYGELHLYRCTNAQTAQRLLPMTGGEMCVYADSAEPKSIADYRAAGLAARSAAKGAGSVAYSMKWLAGLRRIVIDNEACPHTAREFASYAFDRARSGEILPEYPDRDNHHIDAVRYALFPVWKQQGQ